MIDCKECGFFYTDNGIKKCYKADKQIESVDSGECKTFIARQYDGDEPFTPQQHDWLFRDAQEKKQMKNMQGLRF